MAEATAAVLEEVSGEEATPRGPWSVAMRRLLRKKLAVTALIIITVRSQYILRLGIGLLTVGQVFAERTG